MRKADYSAIAPDFDRGRSISDASTRLWLDEVARGLKGCESPVVVDLGCGTGRFALPMVTMYGLQVVGVDASQEMLDQAREKDVGRKVRWMHADAAKVPLGAAEVDGVFMSHLLHHVDDPVLVLREAYRLLRPGGGLFIRYGPMEYLEDDVVHRFFPSAVVIDRERTPTISGTEGWVKEAGFELASTVSHDQRTYDSPADRLRSIRAKGTSVLTMLSGEEFGRGVDLLAAYVEGQPGDPWLLHDRMCLTAGVRR